ncbi:MAG: spore germination protein [Alicyclobacillus sp.]|nr:spore germination protein [Alicyclobacillus sp.]
MHRVQISRWQYFLALFWGVLGTGILTVPFSIAQWTVPDSWISGLLFSCGGLLAAGVTWGFVRSLPGCSLTQGLILTLGPWLGGACSLWFMLQLFLVNCTVLREAEWFVGTVMLPQTPEFLVGWVCVFPAAIAAALGPEVVVRNAEFLTPLALVITPLLLGLSLQHFDPRQLQPVLADGWQPVLRGAVVPVLAYGMEMLFLLQFAHLLQKPRHMPKDILWATVCLTLGLTLVIVLTVGVLGPSVQYLAFPVLETVRSIRIGRFIERIDPLYAMGILSTIFLKLSVFHSAWCEGLHDILRLRNTRAVALPGALALWAGSLTLYRSDWEQQHFIQYVAPAYLASTLFALPLLAAGVRWWQKRRGRLQANSP